MRSRNFAVIAVLVLFIASGAIAQEVSIAKGDVTDPVLAGETISYTVIVFNAGPGDATNVVFSDDIPAQTTFAGGTEPGGWTCVLPAIGGTGTVSCSRATLTLAAGPQVFTLVVTVDPSATGTITNTANVSADTDTTPGDNSAVETTGVNAEADLSVIKDGTPDPVTAGENVSYTIVLSNAGPSDAQNVTLTDTLPAGTTFFDATPAAGFICTPGVGSVSCTKTTVAAGDNEVFTLILTVDPDTTGTITNTASVTSDTTDVNGANNVVNTPTDVVTEADLGVVKVDDVDPVLADGTVTYTVTLTNNGPSDATNIVLTDTIPTGGSVLVGPAPPAGFVCGPVGGTIVCTAATLAAGASVDFVLPFDLDAGTSGQISNSVTVTSDTTDTVPGNDTDTETTDITPSADLSVTKTDSPDPVLAGANITYTITIANAGPSTATGIEVNDNVPAETTFVSLAGAGGYACLTPIVGTAGPVQCTGGTLASGASQVFTLVVAVDDPAVGPISNTATVTSAVSDPAAGNNSANATTAIAAPANADVSILKTAGAGPFVPGDNIPYTITVTNNGPGSATNVTVVDTLPAGTTFVSATPSVGSCSGTGPVNCTLGTLTNGGSATITLIVTSPATPGTFVNNVTVSATETDPTPANDAASASATTGDPAAIPFTSPWVLLLLATTLAVVGATRFRI